MPTLSLELKYVPPDSRNGLSELSIPLDLDCPVTLRIKRGPYALGYILSIVDNTGELREIKMQRLLNLEFAIRTEEDAPQGAEKVSALWA